MVGAKRPHTRPGPSSSLTRVTDSNMAGDTWRWNFHLERKAGGTQALSCEQIIEDDPLVIDPVNGLRNGADIYDALRSMLDNCGYNLGDLNISAIAENIAKLDVAIAKQFSTPSDPAPTSAQERDFYPGHCRSGSDRRAAALLMLRALSRLKGCPSTVLGE
jgi:hypothetical protein